MDTKTILSFKNKYEAELRNSEIPFWEKHCEDKVYGGFLTYLDQDGTVYDTDKYMWAQWRIIYMFATLYDSIEPNKNWLEIAQRGFNFQQPVTSPKMVPIRDIIKKN